jgi:hypothetical protein
MARKAKASLGAAACAVAGALADRTAGRAAPGAGAAGPAGAGIWTIFAIDGTPWWFTMNSM